MKYILTLLAGMVIMSPAAFAEDNNVNEDLQSAEELENEAAFMDFLGLSAELPLSNFDNNGRGRGDRDRRGHDDRGHHRPPPRHRPPPYYPPPRHNPPPRYPSYPPAPGYYDYVCYAENARGERFSGKDNYVRQAERDALDKCYRYSRRCRSLGCRRDY